MFNGFFPTPAEVIDQMVAPFTLEVQGRKYLRNAGRLLEPSAGKGDILDRVTKHYGVKSENVFACEINPDLRAIVKSKGYQVVGDDFLEYSELLKYDTIVMNPDFADGAAQLLHAWDMLEAGGKIACLLNAETVRNPCTKDREVLASLIEMHGDTKFIGSAFKRSERPTDVEVVIVWLAKVERKFKVAEMYNGDFDWDEEVVEPSYTASPLSSRDVLGDLVAQYNRAAETLVAKSKLEAEYRFYIRGVVVSHNEHLETKTFGTRSKQKAREDEVAVTQSLRDELWTLKKMFWGYVFEKTSIGRRATSNFVKEFQKTQEETSRLAFTVENIMKMIEMFVDNREKILLDCICEVFDEATRYHKDNVVHGEGWFTNKCWKVQKQIILPYGVRHDGSRYMPWGDSYNDRHFYEDLDKALCFITGKKIEDIRGVYKALSERLHWANHHPDDRYDLWWTDSTFFEYRFYKKQTVHLKFKDAELLEQFNQLAAKGKMWVGDGQ